MVHKMIKTRSFFWDGNHKAKFNGQTYKYHSAYYLKPEADEIVHELREVGFNAIAAKRKDKVGHVCYVVFWRR